MEIFYGQTQRRFAEGKKFRNARNFVSPVAEAKRVVIAGYYPKIAKAYKDIGIQPLLIADDDPRLDYPEGQYQEPVGFSYSDPAKPEGSITTESVAEIPDGWESMPWPDLRRLAASVSQGATIVSKEDAEIAIRDELERRGPHVESEA